MASPSPKPRSRIGRPYRRIRRWARFTPNGEIALTLIALGTAFLVVAVVIGVLLL